MNVFPQSMFKDFTEFAIENTDDLSVVLYGQYFVYRYSSMLFVSYTILN